MEVLKLIYYNLYKSSRKRNAAPEIPVLSYMTFLQVSVIITGINVFLLLTRLQVIYKIHYVGLFLVITLFGLNYYYFEKKGNGQKIMKNQKMDIGRKSILIDTSLFLSVFLSGFTYYLLREMN